jgi:uncharacterized protein YbjT (DUF2867 family)
MSTTPRQLLVAGATGSIGRRVVTIAQEHGLNVRALVREPARAERHLSGAELIVGDLVRPASLTAAVRGADAVVFTHGGPGDADSARRIDYGGVANVLHALAGSRPRIALMTSIGVTHGLGSYAELLGWKRRSERLVRASGSPYTIVRPGWFDSINAGDSRLVFDQGDTGNGGIGRDQVADVLVRSLLTDSSRSRTFELFAEPGEAPTDWDTMFSNLAPDAAGSPHGAGDRTTAPLEAEPAEVQQDLQRLRA